MPNNTLGLVNRNTNPTRVPNQISFPHVQFDLQPILDRFDDNISDIQSHFQIADDLLNFQPPKQKEAEDIWRSQIVFLESAFDFYIHEIIKYGILKMYNKEWSESYNYKKLKVRLQFALELAQNPNSVLKLQEEIDDMNQWICCMGIRNLREQLNYIGVNLSLNKTEADSLKSLYDRRNQIAHQSDRIPGNGNKTTITKDFVEENINFIINLVRFKIHHAVSCKRR